MGTVLQLCVERPFPIAPVCPARLVMDIKTTVFLVNFSHGAGEARGVAREGGKGVNSGARPAAGFPAAAAW